MPGELLLRCAQAPIGVGVQQDVLREALPEVRAVNVLELLHEPVNQCGLCVQSEITHGWLSIEQAPIDGAGHDHELRGRVALDPGWIQETVEERVKRQYACLAGPHEVESGLGAGRCNGEDAQLPGYNEVRTRYRLALVQDDLGALRRHSLLGA